MRAVDSNVLIRLLAEDDREQARRAEGFLESGRPVWISTVVLVEVAWVLTAVYHWSKPQLIAMLDTATTSRDFAFQSVDTVRAAVELYRASRADFSDCLALELARAEGHMPFATFDRAVSRLPGAVTP